MAFSFNIIADLQQIFQWQFMLNAFVGGTLVSIIAGIVGYFVVLRHSSFAAHALSHIGFAGAAGAVLIGASPVSGLLLFTSGGGIGIALLGPRASQRDVQIGTVLAFMLGIGVLFISLYTGYATEAYSILFGEILGISISDVIVTLIASIIIFCAIVVVYRPLLFASIDEDVAEAKGMPTLALGIIFMLLVAVATSISVQVVGVLLIFALMVTPAAIAHKLSRRPRNAIIISVIIAILATWSGLFIGFFISFLPGPIAHAPVSFFITTFVFVLYLLVRFIAPRAKPSKTRQATLLESATTPENTGVMPESSANENQETVQ
jgi:zinc/manganese transport system permease protein